MLRGRTENPWPFNVKVPRNGSQNLSAGFSRELEVPRVPETWGLVDFLSACPADHEVQRNLQHVSRPRATYRPPWIQDTTGVLPAEYI